MPTPLYHFTCADHGAPAIDRDGVVRPMASWALLARGLARAGLPTPGLDHAPAVAWLTPLAVPHVFALGLTSGSLSCDRTAVRYTVDATNAVLWREWCARYRPRRSWVRMIERGRLPGTWWVTEQPARVLDKVVRANKAGAA